MSSSDLKEFQIESEMLTTSKENEEKIVFPVTVPHSRPRGTWGQWMNEFKLPPRVLDSVVRRYDSKSWSATGGQSGGSRGRGSSAGVPCSPPRWSSVASRTTRNGTGAMKEGGATTGSATAMRGVSARSRRPPTSGRARALLLRPGTPQGEARRPGEVSVAAAVQL